MLGHLKNIDPIGTAVTRDRRTIPLYELNDIPHEEWNRMAAALAPKKCTINSRDVAVMVGKEHNTLLRDIRVYSGYLGESKIVQSDFFIESAYYSTQGKELPCYEITKMGCEMIANKMTGQKGVLFTAAYVKRFNEMEVSTRQLPTISQNGQSDDNLTGRLDRLIALLEQQYTAPALTVLPALPDPESELEKRKFLTRREAAKYIGVGLTTFTDIVNSGDFYPLLRIGHNRGKVYVNREKLDQWLNEQDGSRKAVRV